MELLERTLNVNASEMERYLAHCESLIFKSRYELCSEKNYGEKPSQK
jgi:hypothetical protein